MTGPDVLNAAAALAERQPSASSAIRVSLSFVDRWFPGPRVLTGAQHEDGAVSLAIVLARRCGRPGDVAQVFRSAAGRTS